MNTKTRKLLFWSCFGFFIVLCPILLAYSVGFNFDFNNKKIIPTGSILIKSFPKKVDIYVNENKLEQESPVYINNLIAGEYAVKISKEGFFGWEKKLSVKDYQLTIAENILLLPEDFLKSEVFNSNPDWVSFSPYAKKAVILKETNLYVLNLSINETEILTRVDIAGDLVSIDKDSVQWAADETRISFLGASNLGRKAYYLLSIQDGKIRELAKIKNSAETNSLWNGGNSDIFLYLEGGNLYQLNISTGAIAQLASGVLNFTVSGNRIFFIKKDSGIIYSILDPWTTLGGGASSERQESSETIPSFSKDKKYSIFNIKQNFFIKDNSGDVFIVSDGKISSIYSGAADFSLSLRGDKILFFSDHEISIIEKPFSDSAKLIVRLEEKIEKVFWFDNDHAGYLLSGGAFRIAELDGRSGRNIISPFPDGVKISNCWIDYDTDSFYPILYFRDSNGVFEVRWEE